MVKVTIPGNLRRMHLRWDGHLADFCTDDIEEVMRKEGGRNNKIINLLQGMCDHWEEAHSEMQTPHLFTKVDEVCEEHD
eukprot:12225767-Ditylum_brightwellii.AAC.1